MSETIELKMKGLTQLKKAFRNIPTARVGVLGSKDHRGQGAENSNATIGARHEFGTEDLPVRSFLRMPITEKLQAYLEESRAFTPDVLEQVIREGSIGSWMEKVGATAERIVADAFATGGFGLWAPSNMEHKKVHQTLIETQQLRNAIVSELKK
jgi:hypothetical protein